MAAARARNSHARRPAPRARPSRARSPADASAGTASAALALLGVLVVLLGLLHRPGALVRLDLAEVQARAARSWPRLERENERLRARAGRADAIRRCSSARRAGSAWSGRARRSSSCADLPEVARLRARRYPARDGAVRDRDPGVAGGRRAASRRRPTASARRSSASPTRRSAELRRRLGLAPSPSTSSSTLYDRGTSWVLDLAFRVAPEAPWAWDVRTVADAAFARYLRGASRLRRRPPPRVADPDDVRDCPAASARRRVVARVLRAHAREGADAADRAEAELGVELLRPVVLVGDDEGQVVRRRRGRWRATTIARARPRPRCARQRRDVLDLGDVAVAVEHGRVADAPAVARRRRRSGARPRARVARHGRRASIVARPRVARRSGSSPIVARSTARCWSASTSTRERRVGLAVARLARAPCTRGRRRASRAREARRRAARPSASSSTTTRRCCRRAVVLVEDPHAGRRCRPPAR